MTDPTEKQKRQIQTRAPKKATPGIFDNLRPLPHPVEEILGLVAPDFVAQNETTPLSPSVPLTPSVPLSGPVAPERDFNKRANSLERDALPSGMFPGSSKSLYDALYLRTRGAIKPCRTVRATKKDLADWSGIRNRKTIDGHLRYLTACGLLERKWELGNNEGYLFEVKLPEETPLVDRGTEGDRGGQRGTDQKMVCPPDQKRDRGGQSQVVEESIIYESPKTFKTSEENFDDDAARLFFESFRQVERELTGKHSVDAARWMELAEVLIAELRIAATRTDAISSVPSFLAEHLRRRLWKLDKKQARAEGRELPDEQPSSAQASEQAHLCRDCGGSGWWYPDGLENGVAKCAHKNASKQTEIKESDGN